MRWTECEPAWLGTPRLRPALRYFLIASLLATWAILLQGSPSESKKIAIYSSKSAYTLPVEERNGQDYVNLREVLEPLGKVSVKSDGLHWKIRYNKLECEFVNGNNRARIHGQEFTLSARFLLENGSGLVPLSSLSALLSRFLETPLRYNETSRRLFIGNAGVHFTAQISNNNSSNLVIEFSSPVNPTISTEPGKLRMTFTHEPLLPPGTPTLTFDNRNIPSALYSESNGAAEIVINGNVPLLASYSNNGRTITISSAPEIARGAPPANPPTSPNRSPGQPLSAPSTPAPATVIAPGGGAGIAPPSPHYFAVIDASHGGDERGAALGGNLVEKDVTLALARQLRQALAAYGMTALIIRDGDMTLNLDERANLANRTHPAIYICFHASSEGTGVRLYTSMLPLGEESRGPFTDWETAQSGFLSSSQTAEDDLAAEFQSRRVPVRKLIAPLRPLNNIMSPAVAVEVAPPGSSVADLSSPAYQQLIAESLAAGIGNMRNRLGATTQ